MHSLTLGSNLKTVDFKPIHQEVLDFIEDFREIDEEVFGWLSDRSEWENVYLRGNCYFFASQLSKAFNNAQIWFTECVGHAVAEIEGLFFDVRGILTDDMDWEDYIPSNPFLDFAGKCWSYNSRTGRAGRAMYIKTLTEAIEQPIHTIKGHMDDEYLEDEILQHYSDLLAEVLANDSEARETAIANGWLREEENYNSHLDWLRA